MGRPKNLSHLMRYTANCRCGKACVQIDLPFPIESYAPRQCDCDFCHQHQLAYLSDGAGYLAINSSSRLYKLQHGSEQAIFWQCAACEQIIAVSNQSGNDFRGAVNAQLFSVKYVLSQAIVVSPKHLSSTEKPQRWGTLWLRVNSIDFKSS